MKGVKALLKKGAPTDIFSPIKVSINNGHKVPMKTTTVDTIKSRLLDISALSRLTNENVTFLDNSEALKENKNSLEHAEYLKRLDQNQGINYDDINYDDIDVIIAIIKTYFIYPLFLIVS